MNILTDNTVLNFQKAGEHISAVVGYVINKKLENICNSSLGMDFEPNRLVLKRELAIIVDSLIRPFETKTLGFDGNYK